MSAIRPKPIVGRIVDRWQAPPGLTYALVEDLEGQAWIVQSCPAGTQYWTVDQAAELADGAVSGPVVRRAIEAARALAAKAKASIRHPRHASLPRQGSEVTAVRPIRRRARVAESQA